jgi:hypothetical protein
MAGRLAQWLATSPNGTWQLRGQERAWVPYSMPHARAVGSSVTACGLFAVGWQLFWDIPFDAASPQVCQECAQAIRASSPRTDTQGRV